MAMTDLRDEDLVLMRHTDPEHTGWFRCPAAAVAAFEARGWEVAEGDPPPEPNLAVAELAAFQAEQEAKAAQGKPARKAAKSTAAASSGDDEKE